MYFVFFRCSFIPASLHLRMRCQNQPSDSTRHYLPLYVSIRKPLLVSTFAFRHSLPGSIGEQSRQCQRMREQGPLLVYSHDGTTGGLLPEVPTFWGDYYRENDRDVREVRGPTRLPPLRGGPEPVHMCRNHQISSLRPPSKHVPNGRPHHAANTDWGGRAMNEVAWLQRNVLLHIRPFEGEVIAFTMR